MTVKYLFLFPLDLTNFSSGPISQMTPFEERGTSAYISWKRSLLSSLRLIPNKIITFLKS